MMMNWCPQGSDFRMLVTYFIFEVLNYWNVLACIFFQLNISRWVEGYKSKNVNLQVYMSDDLQPIFRITCNLEELALQRQIFV
jgi:hypothetical protein